MHHGAASRLTAKDVLNVGLEPDRTLCVVAGLVRAHVWVEIVNDIFLAHSLELAVERHQRRRVVGVGLQAWIS